MVKYKKIISILLAIIVLASIIVIPASALSNTSNINYSGGITYNYDKTLLAFHKADSYDYNRFEGTFYSNDWTLFGVDDIAQANYQYNFSVNETGTYYIDHNFIADSAVTYYRYRIIDQTNAGAVYDYQYDDAQSNVLSEQISVDLQQGNSYSLVFNVRKEGIPTLSPVHYISNVGISFSSAAPVNEIDDYQEVYGNPYLTFQYMDEDGNYWFRYSGYELYSDSGNSFTDSSTSGALTFTSIDSDSFNMSLNSVIKYNINFPAITAPITGSYQLYASFDDIQFIKTEDLTPIDVAGGLEIKPYPLGPSWMSYDSRFDDNAKVPLGDAVALSDSSSITGGVFDNTRIYFWQKNGTTIFVNNFEMFVKVVPLDQSVTYNYYDNGTIINNDDDDDDDDGGGGIGDWLPDLIGDALGFLLELLKSLFNAIMNLVVQIITSLVDIFSSFLAGAAENITSFFGLFSADSGAFDFFNGADLTW